MDTRHINKTYFISADDEGDDAITAYGPETTTLIEDCVIDFRGLSLDEQDEAISGVNGAKVIIRRCLIIGAKKALLAGNGDYPLTDLVEGRWLIEDSILWECGRRCPEAQDGVRVIMKRCWIHNFGKRFDERAFGAWSHLGAEIYAEDCLFTQSNGIFGLGVITTIKDIISHIGQSVNMYGLRALFKGRTYLPGICRGLTADEGGKVIGNNCYKNRSWIVLDNTTYMSDEEANKLKYRLVTSLNLKHFLELNNEES